jgi:hypothetical protein
MLEQGAQPIGDLVGDCPGGLLIAVPGQRRWQRRDVERMAPGLALHTGELMAKHVWHGWVDTQALDRDDIAVADSAGFHSQPHVSRQGID